MTVSSDDAEDMSMWTEDETSPMFQGVSLRDSLYSDEELWQTRLQEKGQWSPWWYNVVDNGKII